MADVTKEEKHYDVETMKTVIENIDNMIPLLEKQIELYKQMKRGFEYKIEKQGKQK